MKKALLLSVFGFLSALQAQNRNGSVIQSGKVRFTDKNSTAQMIGVPNGKFMMFYFAGHDPKIDNPDSIIAFEKVMREVEKRTNGLKELQFYCCVLTKEGSNNKQLHERIAKSREEAYYKDPSVPLTNWTFLFLNENEYANSCLWDAGKTCLIGKDGTVMGGGYLNKFIFNDVQKKPTFIRGKLLAESKGKKGPMAGAQLR